MKKIIDKITTNYYKTLKVLADHEVKSIDGYTFSPITQIEIAKKLNISKITMNVIFKQLQDDGLVKPFEAKRGMYKLSDNAKFIIKNIEKMNEI